MLLTGSNGGIWRSHNYQIRVPIDDEHTMHYWYSAYVPPDDTEIPEHLLTQVPPVYHANLHDETGDYNLDLIDAQDVMCWETQGSIADRTREVLGASDRGVVEYRRMLKRELGKSRAWPGSHRCGSRSGEERLYRVASGGRQVDVLRWFRKPDAATNGLPVADP